MRSLGLIIALVLLIGGLVVLRQRSGRDTPEQDPPSQADVAATPPQPAQVEQELVTHLRLRIPSRKNEVDVF